MKPVTARDSGIFTTYRKIIVTGHVLEVYEYERPPIKPPKKDEEKSELKFDDVLDEKEQYLADFFKDQAEQSRYMSNVIRTRNMVRRLALANFDSSSKFVTFTFDDKKVPLDESSQVSKANEYWWKFMKKMRREFGRARYISVIEFHKRGAIHYHCIWDYPYIPVRRIAQMWGCGGVKIDKIDHVDNVGSYLIKYMTKNFADARLSGNKAYNCSKGLERPVVITGDLAEKIYRLYDLEEKKKVFTNSYESEYQGKIVYSEYNLLRGEN